jgi:hypothetical protein
MVGVGGGNGRAELTDMQRLHHLTGDGKSRVGVMIFPYSGSSRHVYVKKALFAKPQIS